MTIHICFDACCLEYDATQQSFNQTLIAALGVIPMDVTI